jgi:hypothetical protein
VADKICVLPVQDAILASYLEQEKKNFAARTRMRKIQMSRFLEEDRARANVIVLLRLSEDSRSRLRISTVAGFANRSRILPQEAEASAQNAALWRFGKENKRLSPVCAIICHTLARSRQSPVGIGRAPMVGTSAIPFGSRICNWQNEWEWKGNSVGARHPAFRKIC